MDGSSHVYRLKEELGASENAVSKHINNLAHDGIVIWEGPQQPGRGGAKTLRRVSLRPTVNVEIATQPVKVDEKSVVFERSWGRIGPGSTYSKHMVVTRKKDPPKYGY